MKNYENKNNFINKVAITHIGRILKVIEELIFIESTGLLGIKTFTNGNLKGKSNVSYK